MALTEGRVWDALCLNPLSVLVVLWAVVSVVWIAAKGFEHWREFWGRKWPLWLTITAVAVLALNGAWNIYKGL